MKGEKIFKQVASIITIVLLLQYVNILAPLMQVRAESATVDGIAWTYETDSNGNAVNVKPSDINSITGDVTIPSELDGHSVINMGDYAFQNCSGLTGITMPSSITSIAYGLFRGCSALKNITIQGQITIIGGSAFSKCSSLTGITIPSSVTSIGDSAFYNCSSLTSIAIPNKVTGIGMNTFCGCSKLANVIIGDGVTYISNWAFIDCSELKSINLPKSLESISTSAFAGCKNLTNIEIPENVESIGNYVFSGCSSLSNVEIPNSVTSIGDYAFSECSNLSSIKIPNSVTSIGSEVFRDCSSLTSIDIPSSVTSIGNSAFAGCSSLTSIEIPEGVTSIGEYAFYNCRSLTSIEIPNSVTSIGEKAFNECKNLLFICEKDSYAYEYAKENNINVDTSDQTIVKFNDENLYSKIKEICNDLGKVKDYNDEKREITVNIIKEIKSLDLSNSQISDLTGIKKFKGLKELNLDNNKISDVSVLDNMQFDKLTLKNQSIEMTIMKYENDLPDILKKADNNKYFNYQIVSYTTNNCSVNDGKVIVKDNFNTNEEATITVNKGLMDGTTCTIKTEDTNNLKIEETLNNSIYLNLEAYKNDGVLDKSDIDICYVLNNGDEKRYTSDIALKDGNNNVIVKFFGHELKNITIEGKVNISAFRKNGRIYIRSNLNDTIKYSLTSNGELVEYTAPISNTDSKSIFVKVGENNIKEVNIDDMTDTEIYDTKTSADVYTMEISSVYGDTEKAVRRNGEITVYGVLDGLVSAEYKLSDSTEWVTYNKSFNELDMKIMNIGADSILIRGKLINDYVIYTKLYIADEDRLGEVTGIYSENNKSYIFRQNRYLEGIAKDSKENIVINDDTEIKQFNENGVIDITKVAGNVLVLKDDGKVYKIVDSNYKLQQITGSEKFTCIYGVYAVDVNNAIWECKYNSTDKQYNYERCDKYQLNNIGTIQKIIQSKGILYVLCTDGKVINLNNSSEIASDVIDISADDLQVKILKQNEMYLDTQSISLNCIVKNSEVPVRINKDGIILTNKGNLYIPNYGIINYSSDNKNENNTNINIAIDSYPEKPSKTGISKLGDYTYQDSTGKTYYIIGDYIEDYSYSNEVSHWSKKYYIKNNDEILKDYNDIQLSKDESENNLKQNKVDIKVSVPENKYKIKMPNSEISEKNQITYEATDNGIYTFEFTDKSNGYTVIRTVHVSSIQSRKETKVPEVTVVNGKIKLESDNDIEYSVDNENWTKYTKEIEYSVPIYARIINNEYECSILKITIDKDGKLNVENTENRKVNGYILQNGNESNVGWSDKNNNKNIELEEKIKKDNTNSNQDNDNNKGLLGLLNKIASDLIYSFTATDKLYRSQSGGYFSNTPYTSHGEVIYKNMENDNVSMQSEKTIRGLSDSAKNIDYSVIYNADYATSYLDSDMKTIYAYVDSDGNLESNIEVIKKAKEVIGDEKYVKVVGDGSSFLILTQKGEVYAVANGNDESGLARLWNKMNLGNYLIAGPTLRIVYKLEVSNIVDIYDFSTALTKDGDVISLLVDDTSLTSAVQELQEQTDKYLVASHLALKDGKLYNLDDVTNGTEVKVGKIVESDTPKYGTYSKENKAIRFFNGLKRNEDGTLKDVTKKDDEIYFDVQESNEQLPRFVDIAENTESGLTAHYEYIWIAHRGSAEENKDNYDNSTANKYIPVYALAENGEVWAYIGGCIVDTGVNLEYFGPTANYNLSNNNWTNQSITLNSSENTTSKVVSVVVKAGDTVVSETKDKNAKSENTPITVEKNGIYTINVTDSKGRTYTSKIKVANIDKLKPTIETVESTTDGEVNVKAYDTEATENYGKSGIAKIEVAYEEPNEQTQWQQIATQVDEKGNTNATVKFIEGKNVAYVRAIDNAGNISDVTKLQPEAIITGKIIVKYQDEEGNSIKQDVTITGKVGTDYSVSEEEINGYEYIEVVGNKEGKYTKEDQEVIFKYKKIKEEIETGKIIVKYQDEEGNSIKQDVTITGKVGTDYSVSEEEINGYEYIEVVGNKEGKYTKENQEVIFKYRKVEEEKPVIPQTGQARTIYLILGLVIIICIGGLVYIKIIKER